MTDLLLAKARPTLDLAIPTLADVREGTEAEVLAELGALALRVEALRVGLVARVLARSGRTTPEPDRLVSVAEAARMLGVSARTMRRLVRRGELPVRQIGARPMFSARMLRTYIRDVLPSPREVRP